MAPHLSQLFACLPCLRVRFARVRAASKNDLPAAEALVQQQLGADGSARTARVPGALLRRLLNALEQRNEPNRFGGGGGGGGGGGFRK